MSAIDDAQEEVKPDMTPMIDVVFLMIIFFICIDFKVLESKLPAFLPKDKGSQSTVVEPQEQLSVKIHVESKGTEKYPEGVPAGAINKNSGRPYRFTLENHRVKWEVGPRALTTIEDVKRELERIARDPNSQVPDPMTGSKKLMSVVIEPYPGTCYEDVAKTTDACRAATFVDINFGGGLGASKR
jgi:hypothetical protein